MLKFLDSDNGKTYDMDNVTELVIDTTEKIEEPTINSINHVVTMDIKLNMSPRRAFMTILGFTNNKLKRRHISMMRKRVSER